jgi:hypothetical protein
MSEVLNYAYRQPHERTYPKPMVPLKLFDIYGEPRVFEWAMVDTGADTTCFPISFMHELGIRESQCVPEFGLTGPGGGVDFWRRPGGIEAELGGYRLRLTASFTPRFPIICLGNFDFLEQFSASFDQRAQRLELEPNADTPRVGEELVFDPEARLAALQR